MLAALRSLSPRLSQPLPWRHPGALRLLSSEKERLGFLELEEVEKILSDVKAGDVRVIPVGGQCDWTDFMVFATGRSSWHVRNIAQALIHKVKQKQEGVKRMMLPTVQGRKGGQWIVIDSGNVVVHALHEKAREYYDLESRWTTEISSNEPSQDGAVKLLRWWNKGVRAPACSSQLKNEKVLAASAHDAVAASDSCR